MKTLLFILTVTVLTACGAGQSPQIGVTNASNIGQGGLPANGCTLDYSPTSCSIEAVLLASSGANECDARNQLKALATSNGISEAAYAALSVSCHADGI